MQKTGSTLRIALSSEDQATATGHSLTGTGNLVSLDASFFETCEQPTETFNAILGSATDAA